MICIKKHQSSYNQTCGIILWGSQCKHLGETIKESTLENVPENTRCKKLRHPIN